MDEQTRLQRLKAKAKANLARPTEQLENISKENLRGAARRAGKASKRAEVSSRRLAREAAERQQQRRDESPADRAAQQTKMAPPIMASLEPTGSPQRLQDMARADRDPTSENGQSQGAQADSLVTGIGFDMGTMGETDSQQSRQQQGPRVDEMVYSGGQNQADDEEMETFEFGLSFEDEDDGGGLL